MSSRSNLRSIQVGKCKYSEKYKFHRCYYRRGYKQLNKEKEEEEDIVKNPKVFFMMIFLSIYSFVLSLSGISLSLSFASYSYVLSRSNLHSIQVGKCKYSEQCKIHDLNCKPDYKMLYLRRMKHILSPTQVSLFIIAFYSHFSSYVSSK